MPKFQNLFITVIAGLGITAGGAASAETRAGPYVGGNLNLYSKYSLGCDAGVDCDKTARIGAKVYGGYDFGAFGIEGFNFSVDRAIGTLDASFKHGQLRADGVGVVGVLPITSGAFTYKGKLGAAFTRGRARLEAGGGSYSHESWSPVVGAGVGYALTKHVSLNADWDQLSVQHHSDSKHVRINMLSFGASYKF